MRLATLLAMTLLFTAGCAARPTSVRPTKSDQQSWVHPTKSDQQWQADHEECKAQAGQAVRRITDTYASSRNRNRSRISRSVTDSCLREKGWAPAPS